MDHESFGRFAGRVTSCHLVTYFVAGVLAYTLLDYEALFRTSAFSCLMRPVTSRWVAAGPALQVVRGLIFAVALYPFRGGFSGGRGWLRLWGLLAGLAVFSTAGAAPGSVEGMIYTKIPLGSQLIGLPEVLLQTLAFSLLVTTWSRHPHRAWGIVMGPLTALGILLSLAGALLPRPPAVD